MANLQVKNSSFFLVFLCTFLISGIIPSLIHGKSIERSNGGLQRFQKHHKRAVEPVILDLPTTQSTDDPQVNEYAKQAAQKLSEISGTEQTLKKILQATFFPPAGKLLYEIKIELGNSQNEDTKVCTTMVWRESDAEPSVTINCAETRRKRADENQLVIADLPMKLSIDDPEVKKYAQKAIDQFGSPNSQDKKAIITEIVEATSYPPAGKLLYSIKLKIGTSKCSKGSNKGNCEIDVEAGDDNCEIKVFRETDKDPSMTIACFEVAKSTENEKPIIHDDDDDYIADLPAELSTDDPGVRKYAQQGLEEYAKKNPGSEVTLLQILEAYYVPESSYSHSIKVKFGKITCNRNDEEDCETNKQETETCTIAISQDFTDESIEIECIKEQKTKRSVEEEDLAGPFIMDKPLQVNINAPEVIQYAQKGVQMYAANSTDENEPILDKVEEALLFPPSGSMLFQIKIKIGTSTCAKGQKENCELKLEGDSKPCTVNVFIENNKPRVELQCN